MAKICEYSNISTLKVKIQKNINDAELMIH